MVEKFKEAYRKARHSKHYRINGKSVPGWTNMVEDPRLFIHAVYIKQLAGLETSKLADWARTTQSFSAVPFSSAATSIAASDSSARTRTVLSFAMRSCLTHSGMRATVFATMSFAV